MNSPVNESVTRIRRIFLFAAVGAFIGSAWGAWSLASRGADRRVVATQAQPPAQPDCPLGYAQAPRYDHTTIVENTNVHWLVRCDPIRSESVISESLELFWTPEILVDPRSRPEALQRFLAVMAQSSHIALEPLSATQRHPIGPQNESLTLDGQGGFRLPTLRGRAWALPAASHTLLVTLVAEESQMAEVERAVVNTVTNVQGLRAFTLPPGEDRSWNITVACPTSWTDATPTNGGSTQSLYVGRYCLAPGAMGGAELTFAEVASTARGPDGARQLFALAATMMRAVGTRVQPTTSDGGASYTSQNLADFSAPTEITVGGLPGFSATATIEPPAAQVSLRGWMATAGDSTLYALGISLKDRESAMKTRVLEFAQSAHLQRPYAPQAVQQRKGERLKGFVMIPGFATALLGALIAWFSTRKSATDTKS